MKNYCEYYTENYGRRDFFLDTYIYRKNVPEGYNPFSEADNAKLLYHFLSILSTQDTIQLNSWLTDMFGRLKSKKGVSNRMYDFVKHLRQGDTFLGEGGGHKDMILHTILNKSEFFEEFIFRFNNL